MSLRVSRLIVTLVALNEHDAILDANPIVFEGDEAGSAVEKVSVWLGELPEKLKDGVAPPSS